MRGKIFFTTWVSPHLLVGKLIVQDIQPAPQFIVVYKTNDNLWRYSFRAALRPVAVL